MTGEMARIDSKGRDSNGEEWSTHAYVARKLRRPLRPFDVYIGPYIDCKEGRLFIGPDDFGEMATACLWPDGQAPAYRAPIVSAPFPLYCSITDDCAVSAARECLAEYRKQQKAA